MWKLYIRYHIRLVIFSYRGYRWVGLCWEYRCTNLVHHQFAQSSIMSMVLQAVFLLAQAVGVAVALALTWVAIYLWNEHRKYAHIPGPKRSRYVICISIFNSKVTEYNSLFSIVVHRWVWPARRYHSLIVSATQEKHLSVSASKLKARHQYMKSTGARSSTELLWLYMTSWNWNIFRVTGHLCGEFTGPRWIPRTKACDAELWCFLWSASE